MKRGLVAVCVTSAIAAGTIGAASAADWPAKPVRIVSPFAPGGTSDTLGRLLAEQLTDKFGQSFFVENRGGAGGLIGSAAVASAEPDGSSFLISSIGTHVTSPATSPNPAYDPLRLFTHIAYLGGPPNVRRAPLARREDVQGLAGRGEDGHCRELHLAGTGNDRASGAGASGAQGKPQIRPRRL